MTAYKEVVRDMLIAGRANSSDAIGPFDYYTDLVWIRNIAHDISNDVRFLATDGGAIRMTAMFPEYRGILDNPFGRDIPESFHYDPLKTLLYLTYISCLDVDCVKPFFQCFVGNKYSNDCIFILGQMLLTNTTESVRFCILLLSSRWNKLLTIDLFQCSKMNGQGI